MDADVELRHWVGSGRRPEVLREPVGDHELCYKTSRDLEMYGLPVTHTTWRTGRPFTLVLEKAQALFEGDAAASVIRAVNWGVHL